MRTINIRSNNNWIIPNTYIRVGGVWVLSSNYVRYLGDWGDELVIYITQTTTNLNLQALFEATYPGSWTRTVSKRLVINSGVIVGATNTSNYALNIPSGFGGTVKVDNNGSIQGAGGASNGGNGGPAILAGASGITINNLGTIYGGGGGGGQGGTGGGGYYTYQSERLYPGAAFYGDCAADCVYYFGAGAYCITCDGPFGRPATIYLCRDCRITYTAYTSGGAGGSGGVGQGYNQDATNGVGGSAGGTNAGTGGAGGAGGAFGTSGEDGFVGANGNNGAGAGGSGGGSAGYYIVNNGNITWTTTGTRLGGVG